MGKRDCNNNPTTVFKGDGQALGGPNADWDQS